MSSFETASGPSGTENAANTADEEGEDSQIAKAVVGNANMSLEPAEVTEAAEGPEEQPDDKQVALAENEERKFQVVPDLVIESETMNATGDERSSQKSVAPSPFLEDDDGGLKLILSHEGESGSGIETEIRQEVKQENNTSQTEAKISTESSSTKTPEAFPSLTLDREILFDDSLLNVPLLDEHLNESNGGDNDGLSQKQQTRKKTQGCANRRWNALSTQRLLTFHGPVARIMPGRFLWSSETYEPRTLAIYTNPYLILILRAPMDAEEIRRLTTIKDVPDLSLLESFFVAESVVDPKTCKIRLSQVTTGTSIPSKDFLQHAGRGGGRLQQS